MRFVNQGLDLGDRMTAALAIHVHSPEARNAEVVHALVAAEGRQVVFTLLTLLARLDDLRESCKPSLTSTKSEQKNKKDAEVHEIQKRSDIR